MTRHILSMADLTGDEVAQILDYAETIPARALEGLGAALVFEHPSARTRNACEMAVVQLGGHPVTIRADEVGIDTRETAEDVARTLACYHSIVAARVARHTTLERMAGALDRAGRKVPVVNLLSDVEHPTQALADLLTIRQHFGELQGRTLAYVGDANNVLRSLMLAGALTGLAIHVSSPVGYELQRADLEWAESLGGSVRCFSEPVEAVKTVDVVYTDVWISMGQQAEADERRRAFEGFAIDESLLAGAPPETLVMHCLPAHRGEEISGEALESPSSVVWQQAENRMHAARGLFWWLAEHGGGATS